MKAKNAHCTDDYRDNVYKYVVRKYEENKYVFISCINALTN